MNTTIFKVGETVICNMRGTTRPAKVLSKKRREEVVYYNVKFDTEEIYEGLTTDVSFPCHIKMELSEKLRSDKLVKLEQ